MNSSEKASGSLEDQVARGRTAPAGLPTRWGGPVSTSVGPRGPAPGRSCARGAARRTRVRRPEALHLLGDIATHADRFDAESGELDYRAALALAEPRGMRPLVAHCHLGLGSSTDARASASRRTST